MQCNSSFGSPVVLRWVPQHQCFLGATQLNVCFGLPRLCREQILDVAASTLSSKPALSSQEAADAIAAVAMLQGLGSAAALQQFLSCRRQWVQQRLLQALAATSAQQEPGAALAELAQQAQDCIAQVRSYWLAPVLACDDTLASLSTGLCSWQCLMMRCCLV